jgi:hypothetical protein
VQNDSGERGEGDDRWFGHPDPALEEESERNDSDGDGEPA